MNIGFIVDIGRRNLIESFCIAYKPIFSKHTLYATESTARWIENASGLKCRKLFAADLGGAEQFMHLIENGTIDMVISFFDIASAESIRPKVVAALNACDRYQIPLAINMSTAEVMVLALDRGDLDWRNAMKPPVI